MAPDTDHALGQQLTLLIQQGGESAFEAGVLSRRLQAQLQDLLGADTTLLIPLRDLFQRGRPAEWCKSRGAAPA